MMKQLSMNLILFTLTASLANAQYQDRSTSRNQGTYESRPKILAPDNKITPEGYEADLWRDNLLEDKWSSDDRAFEDRSYRTRPERAHAERTRPASQRTNDSARYREMRRRHETRARYSSDRAYSNDRPSPYADDHFRSLSPRERTAQAQYLAAQRYRRVAPVKYEDYRLTPQDRASRANYTETNHRYRAPTNEYRSPRPTTTYRPPTSCQPNPYATGYPPYAPNPGYGNGVYPPTAPYNSALGSKYYVGKGLFGQPVVYGRRQPVRNALRSLSP